MKLLSRLTPAETMHVINNYTPSLKDLMKFTFMDLLLKRVLEIKEVRKKAHPRDRRIQRYTYVIAGKNFMKYIPKEHELIFLTPFNKARNIQILFKNIVKMALENTKGEKKFNKSILASEEIKNCFKYTIIDRIFGKQSHTNEGKKVKTEILNYLKPIDDTIADIIKNDSKKAMEIILNLKGNIFLLNNLNFDLIKSIDLQIRKEQQANTANNDDSWLYIDFYTNDMMFGTFFDDFDNTIDSFDSTFDDASCSSADGGCSGCGGCGGCGGCS